MARNMKYPAGWPKTKRQDKNAVFKRSNLRAFSYLLTKKNRLARQD